MKYLSKLMSMLLIGAMLWTVGCTDYDEDIRDLNNKVEDIQQSLMDDQIDPLKADLDATKKALTEAIATAKSEIMAAHKADIDALKAADQTLTKDLEDAKKSIGTLETDLGSLETTVDGIEKDIEAVEKDINDLETVDTEIKNQLATLSQKVSDNYDALKALIDKNVTDIAAVKTALENHVKAFDAFKTEVTGTLAAHEARLKALEDATDKLEKRVDDIDALLVEHKNLIDTNAANIDKLSKHVDDVYAELKKADKDLADLIANTAAAIRGELKDVEDKFDAEFVKAYGEIAKNTSAINALRAEYEAHATAATARFEAIEKVQGEHALKIKTIEEDLTKLNNKVDTELAKVRQELQAAADKALADAKTYADQGDAAVTEAYKKAIADEAKAIRAELAQAVKDLEAKLDALKSELTDLINKNFDALKGRIQSLVFVPEYEDGKATIEYAKFGTNNIDAQSVLLYQVYPAACAIAIEASDLEFVFSDALMTRAANPALEVVKVEEYAKKLGSGIIAVTVKAHDLQEVYATDNAKYAVSLVFKGQSNGVDTNIASSYTVLHREKATEVSNISWALNTGYTTSNKIEYIATNSVEVLSGINVEFDVDGNAKTTAEIEAEYGLKVAPKTSYVPTYSADTYVSALDGETKNSKDAFKNVVREDNGYDVSIALATPDKATVGLIQSIEYGFTLSDKDGVVLDELKDVATVEVTKIKGYMTLDPQTITWARSVDNEADFITPKAPTSRLVATVAGKLVNANGEELATAGTTYADIIAGVAAITVDGVDLASTSYNVVFGKDANNAPTVLFEGFEWNKTYDIVAAYEIDNIIAEVSIKLTTEQKSSVVTLAPSTITWNFADDYTSELDPSHADYLPTFRAVAATADNETLYADVLANGKRVTAANEFVLVADGVEATGFTWNNTYNVEVLYALEDQLVTVKVDIETVKAAFETLKIKLATNNDKVLEKDLQFTLNYPEAEVLANAIVEEAKWTAHIGNGVTVAEFLKAVLETYPGTEVSNTMNGNTYANTKFNVDTAAQKATVTYDYSEMSSTDMNLSYVYVMNTWYGMPIEISKDVNLVNPVFDFFSVETWVSAGAPYWSRITPEYTYSIPSQQNASAFSLQAIKLEDAFQVKRAIGVDSEGNKIWSDPISKADLAANYGIDLKFTTVDSAYSGWINAANEFDYQNGKVEQVRVVGHLILNTGVAGGTEIIELNTKFTEPDGIYKDYAVKSYDPIENGIVARQINPGEKDYKVIELVEAKEYETNVWSVLSLIDNRDKSIFGTYNVGGIDYYGFVRGDDLNGFASGSTPADAGIYGATMKFEVLEVKNLPAEQANDKISINAATGVLKFDYTNKFQALKDIEVTVQYTFSYKYGKDKTGKLVYKFQTK